jgi:hypothetical protein
MPPELLQLFLKYQELESIDPDLLDFLDASQKLQMQQMLKIIGKEAQKQSPVLTQVAAVGQRRIASPGAPDIPDEDFTPGNLTKAATDFENLWVTQNYKAIFDGLGASFDSKKPTASYATGLKIKAEMIALLNASIKIQKYSSFINQITEPDKTHITALIAQANICTPIIKNFVDKIYPLFMTVKSYAEYEISYEQNTTVWNNQILVRIGTLDTTQADLDQVRYWSKILSDFQENVAVLEKELSKNGQSLPAEIAKNKQYVIEFAAAAMFDRLTEVKKAFARAEEKRADLNLNPKPNMPDLDHTLSNPLPNTVQPVIADLSHIPLFAKGMGDKNKVSQNDIQQGKNIDDCPVIASLAAFAKTDPTTLAANITTLTDATNKVTGFQVKLFKRDPQTLKLVPHVETVSPHFYVDAKGDSIYAHNRNGESELWGLVYEKAIAQARGGYDGIEFSDSRQIASMITGRDSVSFNLVKAKTDIALQNQVIAELTNPQNQQKKVILIDSLPDAEKLDFDSVSKADQQSGNFLGLVNGHSYRCASASKTQIELSDPRANPLHATKSTFTITYAQLFAFFKFVVIN